MTSARKLHSLTTAIAAGMRARVGSGRWLPDMASSVGPFGAILLNHRDVSR